MTFQEAVNFITAANAKGSCPGMERIEELMSRLGNPQAAMRFVHVTGTNGKGSAATMLSAILTAAGYRCGLYTSPHLLSYKEDFRVNGQELSDEDFCAAVEAVAAAEKGMEDAPTEYERLTAIAIECFRRADCDISILEVGCGGEGDSTNIIPSPEAAMIMNIGLEHMSMLGDTLEKIATVKSGIIKPGCDAVCYRSCESVEQVLAARCEKVGARLHKADFDAMERLDSDLSGQRFRWRGQELTLALLGEHQLKNAAVVLTTVEALRQRGWNIDETAVAEGLAAARWPARFEVLRHDPLFVVDGGHNPQCAEAMAALLRENRAENSLTFLLGALADKDYRQMLELIWPWAKDFITVTPESHRALPAEAMAEVIRSMGKEATACGSIDDGVALCMERGVDTLAFGSLYMAGHARESFLRRLNHG
ncbi:MAG: bifunctional folylpolyglutamate synthase/dihydrofolate synthase [Ruminococcaceae bacterium]|nr:bifunctional folylpolyglutamate synthase/dihydrofolate synthase [Oscillospiraceae bacterium]